MPLFLISKIQCLCGNGKLQSRRKKEHDAWILRSCLMCNQPQLHTNMPNMPFVRTPTPTQTTQRTHFQEKATLLKNVRSKNMGTSINCIYEDL